eukprot:TRINITY_DN1524_c0_g1_i1.p1 TRINITY_DN1524_c0_g1~~TRINITY_DN1524_c0_g1_i1.p1  ORF type:complete len:237 (-),score=28.53 TRINITY_DN1524_c0_g1_i1:22-732(-)
MVLVDVTPVEERDPVLYFLLIGAAVAALLITLCLLALIRRSGRVHVATPIDSVGKPFAAFAYGDYATLEESQRMYLGASRATEPESVPALAKKAAAPLAAHHAQRTSEPTLFIFLNLFAILLGGAVIALAVLEFTLVVVIAGPTVPLVLAVAAKVAVHGKRTALEKALEGAPAIIFLDHGRFWAMLLVDGTRDISTVNQAAKDRPVHRFAIDCLGEMYDDETNRFDVATNEDEEDS